MLPGAQTRFSGRRNDMEATKPYESVAGRETHLGTASGTL